MKEKKITRYFRVANLLWKKGIPFFPGFIMRVCRVLYSVELPYTCSIGENVVFKHNGLGCVIHQNAIIGKNTVIYQNVSIAGRNGRGVPKIGNNCFIGAGACILGGVIIGDDAKIGANATVIEDVPPGATVVGCKARIIH